MKATILLQYAEIIRVSLKVQYIVQSGSVMCYFPALFSLHICSMWETICDAQAGFRLNSKFLSKFSRKPLSGISDQKAPPPPISENFRFEMTKVYSRIPPPHFGKIQIWDDQSLLRNTPPISENFRFEMTKVYSGIPPPHFGKNFRFEMTSLLRNTPLPFRKMREIVCGDQSVTSRDTTRYLLYRSVFDKDV